MYGQSSPSLRSLLIIPAIHSLVLSSLAPPCSAYIPAQPVNDTSSLNLTDSSNIAISWTDPPSDYSAPVSYQLKADVDTGGTTGGALVHFAESSMGDNRTTATPWIAYISCDQNETSASQEWDIFTLARDRGAVSALLYTTTSQSCLLNQEYIIEFEKPLDVFATKTRDMARLIDNQWVYTNASFHTYNGTQLNISGPDVNASLANDPPPWRTYLIGTLTARNSTGQATPTGIPNATHTPSNGSGARRLSGSMIALYVITGIISVMFIFMVFVGARRALRHPERYGRREATDEQGPQSTAGGIAQAILDTFPVIKFRGHAARNHGDDLSYTPKRISSDANLAIALPSLERSKSDSTGQVSRQSAGYTSDQLSFHSAMESGPSRSAMGDDEVSVVQSASRRTSTNELGSASLAHADPPRERVEDQCPICLVDFEEGDDLRVLPCDIGHVYHQTCIDPWLLQVSSSCPLCRKDFNNPQPVESPQSPSPSSSVHASHPPTQSGFARYLAFMRRERSGTATPSSSADNGRSRRRSRANSGIGQGRRREADQTGPGGY